MSIQQFNKNHASTQPTHIYYDMSVINNDGQNPSQPVAFSYKETRSNDFLLCPQDYYMSIVRFNLQTPTLPIFIPQINVNPDTNLGGSYGVQYVEDLPAGIGNSMWVALYHNYSPASFPVGGVVYLKVNHSVANTGTSYGLNGGGYDYGNSYWRIKSIGFDPTKAVNSDLSTLQLNLEQLTGQVPTSGSNQYPSNTDHNAGALFSVEYGWLPVSTLSYSTSTEILTMGFIASGGVAPNTIPNGRGNINNALIPPGIYTQSLTSLYKPGDTVYIQRAGNYNGLYTALTVTATGMTFKASRLSSLVLTPYTSSSQGGIFLSVGDYANVTPYKITMKYNGGFGLMPNGSNLCPLEVTVPIVFQPLIGYTPPVWNPSQNPALPLGSLTSDWFQIFSYPDWINTVNKAMGDCFWAMAGQAYNAWWDVTLPLVQTYLPTSGSAPNPVAIYRFQQPTVNWDATLQKVIMTADNFLFGQTPAWSATAPVPNQNPITPYPEGAGFVETGNSAFIFFNDPLSTLFDALPYFYPDVPINSNEYSRIIFNFNAGAGNYLVQQYAFDGTQVANSQYLAIQVYQDHTTASLLNPVQSIVFTSTLLPVSMENVGNPLILNGLTINQATIGSTANVLPVVTDFVVAMSATSGYQPDVTYVPSGEYRLVDMYGTSPCKQVDISVFWKDVYGINHPFLLGSGCSGSLKVLFRRKDYNNIEI